MFGNLHDLDENPEATCFLCGATAETREHVIPAWLQRRFDLWNQKLTLPNGTRIPYRKLTIPACGHCNSKVLGPLEQKMEAGTANASEVWQWANKIHFGLSHKDRFLAWDRKNPTYTIGQVIRNNDPLERARHFLHAVAGHFQTSPDPFGSVFHFRFDSPQRFAFAHLLASSSICICLGNEGYIVFVTDAQALAQDRASLDDYVTHPQSRVEDMLFFFAMCIEHLSRHKLGQNIVMADGFIARVGATVVHDVEPINEDRFRKICRALGLEWVDVRTRR